MVAAPRALLHLPGLTAATAVPRESSVFTNAHTNRERLLQLLRSRSQADPRWTLEELGAALGCTTKTVGRYMAWLRRHGRLPLQP